MSSRTLHVARKRQQTATKTRHQPPRICKRQEKFDWEQLPRDILVEILAWSAPRHCCENSWSWAWFGMISRTCKIFRSLAIEHFLPKGLRISLDDLGMIPTNKIVPFLRSFINSKLRGEALTSIIFNEDLGMPFFRTDGPGSRYNVYDALFDNLRRILTVPGVAPNITTVSIATKWAQIPVHEYECSLVRPGFYRDTSRALPRLQSLELSISSRQAISVGEMEDFATALGQSLEHLKLGCLNWLSDEHLRVMLPRMEALKSLELEYNRVKRTNLDAIRRTNRIPNDFGLASVRWGDLKQFAFRLQPILSVELLSILQGCQLRELDLSSTPETDNDDLAGVISHGLFLSIFKANKCSWLTDECINSLVDAQIAPHRGRSIPLRSLALRESSVTPAGLSEALTKAPNLGVLASYDGNPGFIDIGWDDFSPEGISKTRDMLQRREYRLDSAVRRSFEEKLEDDVQKQATWRPVVDRFPCVQYR